jgi:hypothetical protein
MRRRVVVDAGRFLESALRHREGVRYLGVGLAAV